MDEEEPNRERSNTLPSSKPTESRGRFEVTTLLNDDTEPVYNSQLSLAYGQVPTDDVDIDTVSRVSYKSFNSAAQEYIAHNWANDAGSMLGSSLLLSSPSYLNIYQRSIDKGLNAITETEGDDEEDDEDIFDNPEYIDTLEGRLPLAEAARRIAKDSLQHEKLFGKEHIQNTKRDCYRRIICIAASLHFLFSSFFSVRNAQSSFMENTQLALLAYGCCFALQWFGGLCTNPLIAKLKPKWCMAIASIPFIIYPLANFYPHTQTLLPAAVLIGFGWGLLWSSEGVYLMNIASTYALVSGKPLADVVGRFTSIVFGSYLASAIIGNLLGSMLLGDFYRLPGEEEFLRSYQTQLFANLSSNPNSSLVTNPNTSLATHENLTMNSRNSTSETMDLCGIDYFTLSQNEPAQRAPVYKYKIYVFLGVNTCLAMIGFLCIAVLLKRLRVAKPAGSGNFFVAFRRFLSLFKEPRAILIMPLIIYMGFIASIILADISKAYVSCQYGVGSVGLVIMTAFIFSVISAFSSGKVVSLIGRTPVIIISILLPSLSSLVITFLWKPESGFLPVIAFLPACLWGLADGFIFTTINGLLAAMFKKRFVFALTLQCSIFSVSSLFATFSVALSLMTLRTKFIITMTLNLLATTCYIILEVLMKKDII